MLIFLDGTTGYLGSAVARALIERGHRVRAHVRGEDKVAGIARRGIEPVVGDLTDTGWLREQLDDVDGAVHTATTNDAATGAFDAAVADAVLATFAGSDRPYVHTGGTWVHGSGSRIDERTPYAPPPIVAWRPAVLDRVRSAAADGVRSSVVAPANLYGHHGGLLNMIIDGPVADGALSYPGERQSFANVHVDDAAAMFALAIESAPAGSYYLVSNDSISMDEIARAASRLRGLDGQITPESVDATRARIGLLADPFLLDARIDTSHARAAGWAPTRPDLLSDLSHGSYPTVSGATA